MISKGIITSGSRAADYHDKSFAQDGNVRAADNYYLNEKAAATWYGKGAAVLGIEGKAVQREEFVAFLEGRMPQPGTSRVQDLADNAVGKTRRLGYDFTVSPPKSVSVLALVGRDERVVAAHQMANETTMRWFESQASIVRVRDGTGRDAARQQAGNLLWASVTHETDRTNMPQLHNHNVIVAAVYDEQSQKWRSLTNEELFRIRTAGDAVYKRELASHLRAAGYELDVAPNGVDFEVKGFSKDQLQGFAPRSEQIDASLRERGIDPATASYEARQTAALASREAKVELPRAELHQRWDEQARTVGLDAGQMVADARVRESSAKQAPEQARSTSRDALRAVMWAAEHHAEREQAFHATDLEVSAMKFLPNLTIGPVADAVKQLRDQGVLLDRGVSDTGGFLLTTAKGRSVELRLANNIASARGRGNVIVRSEAEFQARLIAYEQRQSAERGKEFKLSSEQVGAARNVLMHRDAMQAIQGEAGTGKTAALAFVREVAESKGWRVIGVATSASAADELGRSSGIPSRTAASFFAERNNQLRVLKHEIAQLVETLGEERAGTPAPGSLVEYRKLDVKTPERSFGEATYSFDHKKGSVFRMRSGILGSAGTVLLDFAQGAKDRLASRSTAAESRTAEVQSRFLSAGGSVAERLGLFLADFQKVDGAESVAARSTLASLDTDPKLKLARQLGLKRAELRNLRTYGDKSGMQTLLMMDETSLTGAADLAKLTTLGRSMCARTVLQGDTKQHGSPAAGRAFAQAQELGVNTAFLRETMRFKDATENVNKALEYMQQGRFSEAYSGLQTTVVDNGDLAKSVAGRYVELMHQMAESTSLPGSIGVSALTNFDRKAANEEIHSALKASGAIGADEFKKEHLDAPKMTRAEHHFVSALQANDVSHLVFFRHERGLRLAKGDVVAVTRYDRESNLIHATTQDGRSITVNPSRHEGYKAAVMEERKYSVGDRIEAREVIRLKGEQGTRVNNGTRGRIETIDQNGISVQWDDGRKTQLSNAQVRFVDHSYARTTFKEQGATNKHELLMVSDTGAKIFNREAAYVAATRAKLNTEVFTSNKEAMVKNANKVVAKETALTKAELGALISQDQAHHRKKSERKLGQVRAPVRVQELTRD